DRGLLLDGAASQRLSEAKASTVAVGHQRLYGCTSSTYWAFLGDSRESVWLNGHAPRGYESPTASTRYPLTCFRAPGVRLVPKRTLRGCRTTGCHIAFD